MGSHNLFHGSNASSTVSARPITRSHTNGTQQYAGSSSSEQIIGMPGPSGCLVNATESVPDGSLSCNENSSAGQMAGVDIPDDYNSPFSPDDSSYSENSDYTSDEYEPTEVTARHVSEKKAALDAAREHHRAQVNAHLQQQQQQHQMLPSFPTITSAANVAYSPVSPHAYQMPPHHFMPSNGGLGSGSILLIPGAMGQSTQYVLHQPQHFAQNQFHGPFTYQYIPQAAARPQIPAAQASPLPIPSSTTSSAPLPEPQQPTACTSSEEDHHYTDLSQSIASSKSAESLNGLLSAANGTKELTRVVSPVSMVPQMQVTTSSHPDDQSSPPEASVAQVEMEDSSSHSNPLNPDSSSDQEPATALVPDEQALSSPNGHAEELSENFGEIIKKTMVETVSA